MSHFYFDLNINNYSANELKSLIKLPKSFNLTTIENNILSIKEKIIHLKLPKDENQQYLSFLNHLSNQYLQLFPKRFFALIQKSFRLIFYWLL